MVGLCDRVFLTFFNISAAATASSEAPFKNSRAPEYFVSKLGMHDMASFIHTLYIGLLYLLCIAALQGTYPTNPRYYARSITSYA
jgi:hypothetical protein